MVQHNEHRTLVENLNREFGAFVPEYARIVPEIFDLLMILIRPLRVFQPGIRERTAIARLEDALSRLRVRLRP